MTQTVTAVYENGVLRPTTPLELADGATVELSVALLPRGDLVPAEQTAAIMRAIAATRVETGPVEHVSADVDRYLYVETFGGRRRDHSSEPRSGGSS